MYQIYKTRLLLSFLIICKDMSLYGFQLSVKFLSQVYIFDCQESLKLTVVFCINRSPFSCSVIEIFILIEPLLRGHLYLKITFSLSQMYSLNTCFTVYMTTYRVVDTLKRP
jgi:hypothetical protein